MNRVFGWASSSESLEPFERCVGWLQENGERVSTRGEGAGPRLGVVRDGAVVGEAGRDGQSLVFLGHLSRPLPGWPEGSSPLDAPDETAEWLLARFAERGEGFLDGVGGHYVLALADGERLYVARGPSGQRRLFVREEEGGLAFSTLLSDFGGLAGPGLKVDRSWEDFLLGHEFLPGDRTLYEGVRGLAAGTLLRWEGGATEERRIAQEPAWADWLDEERLAALKTETREGPVVEVLGDAFLRAVEELAPDAEKVGVLLGGFDSALVVSALARLGKEVETFSFRYADDSFNQPLVEELGQRFSAKHNWVPITPAVIRDGLTHYAERFNQPVSQPHYVIASSHAIRAMSERGIAHGLSGDGCDGLFLGYPTVHQRAVLIQSLSRLAPGLLTRLSPLARSGRLERRLGQPYRLARNVMTILERPSPVREHIAACTLDRVSLAQLRREPPPPQAEDVEETLRRLARGKEDVSPVRLAYMGKSMVGLNRVKLEGSCSYAGVSIHSPFLHPGMKRLAGALPENMSRPQQKTASEATGKYALMRMAEERAMLPPEMIYQAKRSPVTAPVDHWYMGELKPFMLEQLGHLPFAWDEKYARSLLSHKLAEDALRRYVGLSRYAFNAISLLVTYASFCRFAQGGDRSPRA